MHVIKESFVIPFSSGKLPPFLGPGYSQNPGYHALIHLSLPASPTTLYLQVRAQPSSPGSEPDFYDSF